MVEIPTSHCGINNTFCHLCTCDLINRVTGILTWWFSGRLCRALLYRMLVWATARLALPLVLNSVEVCLCDVPALATASYDPYGSFMPSLCPIASLVCGFTTVGSNLTRCAIHMRGQRSQSMTVDITSLSRSKLEPWSKVLLISATTEMSLVHLLESMKPS